MPDITDPRLIALQGVLSPESFAARVAEAEQQSPLVESILAAEAQGLSRLAAIRELRPGDSPKTWAPRVANWQRAGWQALVNRRFPIC